MTGRIVVIPQLGVGADAIGAFVSALEVGARVDVVEPPGYSGDAPVPSGAPSTQALARAVLERWPVPAGEAATVFGISLGGMIAQWIALDAPERVDRLVLASTTDRALSALPEAVHAAGLARCLVLPRDEAAVCLAQGVLGEVPLPDEARESLADDPPRRRDLLWLAAAAAMHHADVSLLRAPTLVLSGGDDALVPVDVQRALAERLPDARHVILDGVGHDVILEDPERAAAHTLAAMRGPDFA